MANFDEFYKPPYEENRRSRFLTLLCILTFVYSGYSLLVNLLLPAYAPTMLELFSTNPAFVVYSEIFEQIAATPIWQFYIMAFLNACSILGAVYMLKMKKVGFHIYVVSQLAQMCIGQFLIGGAFKPNFFSILMTILFIGLYTIYYKRFTSLNEETIEELEENINDNE